MRASKPADALTALLCARVRRETESSGDADGELPRVVGGALHRPALSDDERSAYRRFVDARDPDPLGGLLSLRIESALGLGRAHARRSGARPAGGAGESVLVLRRSTAHGGTDLEAQVSTAMLRIRALLGERGPGDSSLFLLAHEAAFERLRRRLPDSAVDRIVFYTRSESSRSSPAASPIEVHEVEQELAPLEERMRSLLDAPAVAAQVVDREVEDPLVGALLHGKYRILRRIGTGGFGSVYEARDERGAGNRVAIKLLRQELARNEELIDAFREEARRLTRLGHPNVVDWKVFDEDEDGKRYFVMELVDGLELDRLLEREGPLAPARAARLLLQILDALRAAHHARDGEAVLHLDLKPRNVFVLPARAGRAEQVKVIDFGIGQFVGLGGESLEELRAQPLDEAATDGARDFHPTTMRFAAEPASDSSAARGFRRCTGCTPEYASPEQSAHALGLRDILPLDGRSDLYSLGVMAFQMLTGELPFARPLDRTDFLHIHRERPPRRIAAMGRKVPRSLARFVERCLEKDRERRFRDADEAWRHVERIVHPPVLARAVLLGAPLVVAAFAIGAVLRGRGEALPLAVRAGAVELDEQSPLYLGAARTEVELELPSEVEADGGLGWGVERAVDGRPLDGFELAPRSSRRVALRAVRAPDGRMEASVRLRIPGLGDRLRPFPLVWIGAQAWSIERIAVGGEPWDALDARAVDPVGVGLDLWLGGEAREEIDGIELRSSDGSTIALRTPIDEGERRLFSIPLERLGLAAGRSTLALAVRDRAGRELVREIELEIAVGALAPPAVRLLDRSAAGVEAECNRAGASYWLTPRTLPLLEIATERASDLAWRIAGPGLERAPAGESTGRARHAIALEGLAQLAGGAAWRASLHWQLSDAPSVLRARGSRRDLLQGELALAFEPAAADVEARILGPDGLARHLSETAELCLASRAVELAVVRAARVSMRVLVELRSESGEAIATLSSDALRNLALSEASFPLRFPHDGRFELAVQAFPFDAQTDAPADRAETSRRYALSVDVVAPSAALHGISNGEIVTEQNAGERALELVVDAGGAQSTPVDATWQLLRGSEPLALCAGRASALAGDSARVRVDLSALWASAAPPEDGEYRLEARCSDRAGNEAPPCTLDFTLALRGPRLLLESPLGGATWHPGAGRRFAIQVRAEDQNGVARVVCRPLSGRAGVEAFVAELERRGSSTWAGEVELSHAWSELELALAIEALDACGARSELVVEGIRLPAIARPRPSCVAGARGGRMRLVERNAAVYLFGGQGDDVEDRIAREAGLPPFNPDPARGREYSWQVPYPPGGIESFYLDEHEVSVAEFRAFLVAPDGWSSSQPWLDAEPDAKRAAVLGTALAELAGEQPVTDVSWLEARAFARWAEKRLPSWVEWEYALRGVSYRPVAPATASAEINAAGHHDGPWLRGRGSDVVPDSGIRDLSGNVSEWTASPAFSDAGMRQDRALLARWLHPAALMRDPAAPAYWIAGASHASPRFDFSVAEERSSAWSSARVGFRCALSLEEVQAALDARRLREVAP